MNIHQMEVDIVLRDVRRWTQNLYLSENLRRRDEFGDKRVRKLGQLFIEIGSMIDTEYIRYRKQFSLRKKLVRFVKYKFGQITNETSQKLKNFKNKQSSIEDDNHSSSSKKRKRKKNKNHNDQHRKKKKKKNKRKKKKTKKQERPSHIRCHTIDVGMINKLNDDNNKNTPTLTPNKSVDLEYQ